MKTISEKSIAKARKRFTLFMSNKDVNDIIKLVESLQNSDLLVDGAIEAVKNEIKKGR